MNKTLATKRDLLKELWLRMREQGLIVWKTQKGDLIPIKNMSDTYLINTINMLHRAEIERGQYYEALGSIGEGDFCWDKD